MVVRLRKSYLVPVETPAPPPPAPVDLGPVLSILRGIKQATDECYTCCEEMKAEMAKPDDPAEEEPPIQWTFSVQRRPDGLIERITATPTTMVDLTGKPAADDAAKVLYR
jgi:hypothetical protein